MLVHVLPSNIADKIAAGEVVERPASVVKELVENAIDAGAKNIAVEIRRGGMTFIRVTDDGIGMTPDDAKTAFLRHATSKIKEFDDLNRIHTFGFRGEALAAISSVSKVELITCTDSAECAFFLTLDGGKITQEDEIAAARGTTIIIRDLFYNTPARLNFMKKDSTEASTVITMMQRIAIGKYDVAFTLISDGKVVFRTGVSSDMKNAIYSIFGESMTKTLSKCDFTHKGITVTGYACSPEVSRANRNMQFTFLNGRFIRSKYVFQGIDEGYQTSKEAGKHPVCFLNIEMDPSSVDVNVHPAKLEVKFLEDSAVLVAVKYAITNSKQYTPFDKRYDEQLGSKLDDYSRQPLESATFNHFVSPVFPFEEQEDFLSDDQKENQVEFDAKFSSSLSLANVAENSAGDIGESIYDNMDDPEYRDEVFERLDQMCASLPANMRLIGEVFKLYFLIEYEDEFYIVDKHAVHEKIIYNKLRWQLEKENKIPSQQLIRPIVVPLTAEDVDDALRNINVFNDAGFDFFESSIAQVSINAIPSVVSQESVIELFMEVLHLVQSKKADLITERQEKLIKMISCRCAIKGGKACKTEEMIYLLKEWVGSKDVDYCPHGRPVMRKFSKNDFDKLFKRIK